MRDAPAGRLHVSSERYGWTNRANWTGQLGSGPPIAVNVAGRRGPETWSGHRPSVRVLLLGDSIAFGVGVADDETFGQLLQRHVPGFEVLNFGVSGYGTDQALLQLEDVGLSLRPDVVVLNFCVANDYVDNVLPTSLYDGRAPKPYFELEDGALRLRDAHLQRLWLERAGILLRDRSYLFDASSLITSSWRETPAPWSDQVPEHWESRKNRILSRDFARAKDVTGELISRMDELCRRRGIRFLVLVHPDRRALKGDDTLLLPFQEPRFDGMEIVDLQDRYARAGLHYKLVTLDKIGHLSPMGHAIVARILREALLAESMSQI